ncbi:MAG: hypothetical protein ACK40K_06415, partial [Raineya sp.]
FLVAVSSLLIRNQTFSFIMLIVMGAVYSLLAIASLPYVLHRAKAGQAGHSIGLYYGGTAASTAFVLLILLLMGIQVN